MTFFNIGKNCVYKSKTKHQCIQRHSRAHLLFTGDDAPLRLFALPSGKRRDARLSPPQNAAHVPPMSIVLDCNQCGGRVECICVCLLTFRIVAAANRLWGLKGSSTLYCWTLDNAIDASADVVDDAKSRKLVVRRKKAKAVSTALSKPIDIIDVQLTLLRALDRAALAHSRYVLSMKFAFRLIFAKFVTNSRHRHLATPCDESVDARPLTIAVAYQGSTIR
jgi:hypothetical protein